MSLIDRYNIYILYYGVDRQERVSIIERLMITIYVLRVRLVNIYKQIDMSTIAWFTRKELTYLENTKSLPPKKFK